MHARIFLQLKQNLQQKINHFNTLNQLILALSTKMHMALIYLMRPWTSTNEENFQTSMVNYISKIAKNDPIQHIYVKSV